MYTLESPSLSLPAAAEAVEVQLPVAQWLQLPRVVPKDNAIRLQSLLVRQHLQV